MLVLDRSPQNFRLVFWLAVIPGMIAVMFLIFGVKEPRQQQNQQRVNPLNRSVFKFVLDLDAETDRSSHVVMRLFICWLIYSLPDR